MLETKRIHPFESQYINDISNSDILKKLCKELWVFGSTVSGASDHKHDVYSDIDLAVYPLEQKLNKMGYLDLSTQNINTISREIRHIMSQTHSVLKSRKPDFDIVWMDDGFPVRESKLFSNIMKGVRLI